MVLVLALMSAFFSIGGGYLKTNHLAYGNLFLIISVFITPIFLLSLLMYIRKLRKKQE